MDDEEEHIWMCDSSIDSLNKTPEFITVDRGDDESPGICLGRHWTASSYPAWAGAGISVQYIASVVTNVQQTLGFQYDASINVFELLMSQLDSRASRSSPELALKSLHADYIAAPHANYRKWYFAAKMDCLDNSKLDYEECTPLAEAQEIWQLKLYDLSSEEIVCDLVVYLSCWCEANQVRYMPECLAFIYKCARDFYTKVQTEKLDFKCPKEHFLQNVISPLYNCYFECNYEVVDGVMLKKETDHRNTVGYDDINQLFWYLEGIKSLKLKDQMLVHLPADERYLELGNVQWKASIRKTYRETRSWVHIVTNFSRVIILHASVFWFYTAFNVPTLYTPHYNYRTDKSPMTHIQLTTVALGGTIGPIVTIVALAGEFWFVPRSFSGAQAVLPRLGLVFALLCLLVVPSIYIYFATSWIDPDKSATVIAGIQFAVSLISTVYFSVQPLSTLFYPETQPKSKSKNDRNFLANKYFTSNFRALNRYDTYLSWFMSILILVAKFTESYFYLTLSVRDPIYELSIMNLTETCLGDVWLGSHLCNVFPKLILAAVLLLELILFFLDTYLWYVIINASISVIISFYLGASIWTPWRNIYIGLPKRISSKLLTDKKSVAIKIIWNAIIQDMAYNYFISRDQARELMYTKKYDAQIESHTIVEPIFFTAEEDGSQALPNQDAQRRVSFFAQSLAQPIPEPMRTDQMPGFTVLIPHYTEKIALSLKDTIKHSNGHSKVTILEYLQKLYPSEWQHFVEESKRSARIVSVQSYDTFTQQNEMLVNILGFSSSKPQDTNKTRLWCSARAQTLYRTVNGFMSYANAIKLLHYSETDQFHTPDLKLISGVDDLVKRKFRLIIAMQKYASFNSSQLEDTELLLSLYPDIKIVYVDTEKSTTENGAQEPTYYSSLIDSTCEVSSNGRRRPRYRIKVSGNPILGDGKSDNQNHALIFYRGEYLQLIDSNQDNYLEECLKIRNVLAEFEEISISSRPYDEDKSHHQRKVAIVGAREYIFSENIGVLGDVAAGKEQTFGTLFARTLARIGGKLHYGHPDFLNAIFMTTRGGISKAQKGLHLNEDIYAGMMSLCRGGIIKHTEYIQCGKGRDLGFVSILNFTTKVGAGMGEQILSREYFWLGTKLPFDRFMSFYYGHPGFHLNNVSVVASIELFLTILTWIATVKSTTRPCDMAAQHPKQLRLPPGCSSLEPLKEWITRCVGSIALVFVIAQLPLFIQELSEKGLTKSVLRICKHFFSLSMLFEIFVCQIYACAFSEDLSLGGAKYISTGRGFATTRAPLHVLFEGYSSQSIYFGARSFLVLVYVSALFWHPALLWFWLTVFALTLSPTIFNPHQFNLVEFFLDYKCTLQWFSNGGWVKFTRQKRAKITGYRTRGGGDTMKPSYWKLVVSEVFNPALSAVWHCLPYIYIGSQRLARFQKVPTRNPILQILVLGGASYACNVAAVLLGLFGSLILFFIKESSIPVRALSSVSYGLGFLLHIGVYFIAFMLNKRDFPDTILGILAISHIERLLIKLSIVVLGRQLPSKEANEAWWTGHWGVMKRGYKYWMAPIDELLCKTAECGLFSMDFLVIHFMIACQIPLVLIPKIDDCHSMFLLWLSPSQPLPVPIRQARQQKQMAIKSAVACILLLAVLGTTLAIPAMLPTLIVQQIRGIKLFG